MTGVNENISWHEDGDIGVILCNNPPVNALSHPVREGIVAALAALAGRSSVKAIVLGCEGRTFFAGADISEFGKPKLEPRLQKMVDAIERFPKPVVAAMHGTTLGGGLEVALGCHYRIASHSTRMGLPEIKLGIIPGAGGTQRLPRIIGPEAAIELIMSGDAIGAQRALELGIVDALTDGDPVAEAIAFARKLLDSGQPAPAIRDRTAAITATRNAPEAFERLAAALLKRRGNEEAPGEVVASLRRSFTIPIDDALAIDAEVNDRLIAGSQAKALRHLFFAERKAAKIAGIDKAPAPQPVRKVAVIGAGTMGRGICMTFAAAGIPVSLVDSSEELLTGGIGQIRKNFTRSAQRGSIAADVVEQRMASITGTTEIAAAVAGADLVIEAVFENLEVKRALLKQVEAAATPSAVLATNTSALDIDEIAGALAGPELLVGMHYFSPANVMKLLEVVRGSATSPAALVTAMAVGRQTGKIPVISGNCDGFIGNRMVAKRSAQAERLLQRGAMPPDIDGALRSIGFPMGPLETNDMSGLDVGYAIRKRRGTPFPIADAIVEQGWLGQKTGSGYYRYEGDSRTPLPNPDAEAIILATSERLGISRRAMDRDEIVERLLFPLINEGARILEEGIAARGSDVDLVWAYGYGWPRYLGGPMFYADQRGLPYVIDRLEAFATDTPEDPSLIPAPLLRRLASEGSRLSDWSSD